MAEGGNFGRTVLGGSDAIIDLPCSPCKKAGDPREATKYCPSCKQYLCSSCSSYHSRLTSTKHHQLTDALNVTQGTTEGKPVTIAKCPVHINRDIEMYCGTHDVVCCAMCIAKYHRSCANVDDVSVAAQTYFDITKIQELQVKLDTTLSALGKTRAKKTQNVKSLLDNEQTILKGIEDFRKHLTQHLDDLEKKAKHFLQEKRSELSAELEDEIKVITKAVASMHECKEHISQGSLSSTDKFVYLKLGHNHLVSAEALLAHEQKVLTFTESKVLIDAVTEIKAIGRIEEVESRKMDRSGISVIVDDLIALPKSDDIIKKMTQLLIDQCSTEELVDEMKMRGKRQLLLTWLEDRRKHGMTDSTTHTSLAKLYVDKDSEKNDADIKRETEDLLRTNQYYNSKEVGKYCEKKNPRLACLIYERYQCDMDLIRVCNGNTFFETEARYLIKRQDPSLWSVVLNEDNIYRRQLIDECVQVISDVREPDQLSTTVKAFMEADLPHELIELLEMVLGYSIFKDHRNLQNLLILTAIKADRSRVMEFVNRFDNYDAPDIANIALSNELFDEANAIYKKFDVESPTSLKNKS